MTYYLIAGEASGDLHGANLMRAIRRRDPDAVFHFWGGDRMAAVGGTQVEDYRNTAFMGFWEVVRHLPAIWRFLRLAKRDIARIRPDVVVLIDYPGFNLRIAKWLHTADLNTRVVYYIAPQAWAWKPGRTEVLRRTVDDLLVILPFEEAFFTDRGCPAHAVGHPLLDALAEEAPGGRPAPVDGPVLALLPGSREQEVKTMLPRFLSACARFTDHTPVVAAVPGVDRAVYEDIVRGTQARVVVNDTTHILRHADAALVTSGTATLECALLDVPMVVAYSGSWLSYTIGRRLVTVSHISLVNLVLDEGLVPELIQDEARTDRLRTTLLEVMSGPGRQRQLDGFDRLRTLLGGPGASDRAAARIVQSS